MPDRDQRNRFAVKALHNRCDGPCGAGDVCRVRIKTNVLEIYRQTKAAELRTLLIVERLIEMGKWCPSEERWGKQSDGDILAKLLAPARPTQIRFNDGSNARGYRRCDVEKALRFEREISSM